MLRSLDPVFCRERQNRLRSMLADRELDAAVFMNRHYVHALTGYWHGQPLTSVAVVVIAQGSAILVLPEGCSGSRAVDEHAFYVTNKLATFVENVDGNLLSTLLPLLQDLKTLGGESRPLRSTHAGWVDITRDYQYLRRMKDPDELALLRFAISAAEEALGVARGLMLTRPTETEIHAEMYAAALRKVGELPSGWGNDFQSGSPGGAPRARRIESGELAVYDVGVGVRGYRSDLCRTFVVDEFPTEEQRRAHARILEVFDQIEGRLKPGLECRELYSEIHEMLDGWEGYVFPHHLGHGIGLDAHEVPRLNPEWDDTLRLGDVIAVEPALYGPELRAGIRLEQNYLITESGAERLSHFPLDL